MVQIWKDLSSYGNSSKQINSPQPHQKPTANLDISPSLNLYLTLQDLEIESEPLIERDSSPSPSTTAGFETDIPMVKKIRTKKKQIKKPALAKGYELD